MSQRPSCGQTVYQPQPLWLGSCGQQYSTGSPVQVLHNVTQMKNYASGSPNPYIDPEPTLNIAGAPVCSPDFGTDCGDGINGNPWCFANINDTYFQTCGGGTSSLAVGAFHNCYVSTNQTMSLNNCFNDGWKGVAANKVFHGIVSYTSAEWGSANNYDWCGAGACQWSNLNNSPDQTHYLSISANASFSSTQNIYDINYTDAGMIGCDDSGSTCSDCSPGSDCACFEGVCFTSTLRESDSSGGNASSTCTIDQFGNISATCSSGSFGCDTDLDPTCPGILSAEALGLISMANTNNSGLLAIYSGFIGFNVSTYGAPSGISGGGTDWTVTWDQDLTCLNYCGTITSVTPTPVAQCSITANSVDIYKFDFIRSRNGCTTDGECPVQTVVIHYHYSYTPTTFTYYKDTFTPFGGADLLTHEECNGTLGVTYTNTQVLTQLTGAMSHWDMGNDALMPWQGSTNLTIVPLVTYDEGGYTIPTVPTCDSTGSYTGGLVGLPGPIGIDKIWNPAQPNYCVCSYTNDSGELVWVFYLDNYGQYSTFCGVPSATQWTSIFQANNLPAGAVCGNGFQSTFPSSETEPSDYNHQTKWGMKYAEAIIPGRQSYNFDARPCGYDRFEVSASTGRCISGSLFTGTTGFIAIDTGSVPNTAIASGSLVWICGLATGSGLWTATSATSYTVNVANLQLSASSLALPQLTDCGSGVIGAIRWQPLKPAICGILPIAGATNTNPVTCSFNQPIFFVDGDQVQINGSIGMNINGIQTIKTIDSSHVALVGVNQLTGSLYFGGAQMNSLSASLISDSDPKGDYATKQWFQNYRDVGEYQRVLAETGVTGSFGCDGVTPCAGPNPGSQPRPYQGNCGLFDVVTNSPICTTNCFPYNSCNIEVAYFSPNAESFNPSSSVNFGWHDPGYDDQYPALWQASVFQTMNDPLAVAPPCVCSQVDESAAHKCVTAYEADNGTCEDDTDTIQFYAAPAEYEARCEVPDGRPALPPGIYLGCLSPNQFTSPTCPPGNICNPPPIPATYPFINECGLGIYEVDLLSTPWIDLSNRTGCVCTSGRFAPQYSANGFYCFVNQEVSPI